MMAQAARIDIRWRVLGGGPKVVLLHGGMQTSANFTRLARSLAGDFTVYVPDRRGRGRSGPARPGHGLRDEIGDLAAVLDETGARNVFGLSSGAVIALRAAMELPIERLALYEPPLKHDDHDPLAWLPRFERELSRGHRAAALVTAAKGTGDFRYVPRAALVPLLGVAIRVGAGRPIGDLIPTMRLDAAVVEEAAGPLGIYRSVTAETLLLGGDRSPAYLTGVLNGLEPVLPRVRRVTLTGVGHLAADDSGRPETVAAELRKFFR
ncbi:alpha/beta hydrolase [Actinoplanes philippinensis]|uniref:Lysophospholipase, alpha-beta hydrolase superfamily n=1 Tax=Actinoplanes philippinensis TaxID=35752 RepID=A0A1I2J505_9ACTN|nr:alpha/beta hydrolase [Actinoplanes philippinensis]GIE79518.1 alpha/beta hydrolase [Actinoplanes philippinensis]SFF49624.1 Lysophospholipase, alpha-beta hydrolase superfamily [Actinoplanes philippinensis]